jgi:hypothetical protein
MAGGRRRDEGRDRVDPVQEGDRGRCDLEDGASHDWLFPIFERGGAAAKRKRNLFCVL